MTGDAAQVAALLEWALERGVRFDAVTVGGCHVVLGAVPMVEQKRQERAPLPAIYEQYGGELWKQAVSLGGAGGDSDSGSDLEPALDGGGR